MGLLVDGVWRDQWYDTKATGGSFERKASNFRDWIVADGEAPPEGRRAYPAEANRYHLYVSLACPWAHRALIVRALKRLENVISISVVDHLMAEEGWVFSDRPGTIPDNVNGKQRLYEIYRLADPHYTGRVTVPVLWDRASQTIVNNESSDIIRMLNRSFDAFGDASLDLAPGELLPEIDALNARIYETVNNGVYRCGFATTQDAYEAPFHALFETLDLLEDRLSRQRFLIADRLTEADWRLFTTLIRFDAVYHGHFKCNRRRIADYPNLFNYMLELYQWPGVAATVDFRHIKGHYYESHKTINPTGVVPLGPEQDLWAAHDRGRFTSKAQAAGPAEAPAAGAASRG